MKNILWLTAASFFALTASAQNAPTITAQPISQAVLGGGNAVFTVGVSGSGPFTYQWRLSGTNLPRGIITTVAGNGVADTSGDYGLATSASIFSPFGVAVDNSGNIFFTEPQWIKKVDTNGIITTVAGNGTFTNPNSDGLATKTSVNNPYALAVDDSGNLFIADSGNYVIRKVGTNGVITTVAGNGLEGYQGDGGAGTNARLSTVLGIALDRAGNLFLADSYNDVVRRVDTNGVITTVAGNGIFDYLGDGLAATNASVGGPFGVAVDASGNLFISESANSVIRRVGTNGIISTFAGGRFQGYGGDGGAATNASLNIPQGIALDGADNLFIADLFNNAIRRVGTNGIITTVAGTNGAAGFSGDNGAATNSTLNYPVSVAANAAGDVFIADNGNNRIREIVSPGPVFRINNVAAGQAGNYDVVVSGPHGSVTSGIASLTILFPPVISAQPQDIWVAVGQNAILAVKLGGGLAPFSFQWYLGGSALAGQTNAILTLASVAPGDAGSYDVVIANQFGSVTSRVAVLMVGYPPVITSQPASQIVPPNSTVSLAADALGTGPFSYRWQFNGVDIPPIITTIVGSGGAEGFSGDGGLASRALLDYAAGVAMDNSGNLFVADCYNKRIRKVGLDGVITTIAGGGASGSSGGFSGDGGPATSATLKGPTTVLADGAGNLSIADGANFRVRKVANGIITTVAGNGTAGNYGDGGPATNAMLSFPAGMTLDGAGNLLIVDSGNNRIRRVGSDGYINTVIGTGKAGYSGDGGPASVAELNNPSGIARDTRGNLYIADNGNFRIRKVDVNGFISTVAGNGTEGYSGDGGFATNASLRILPDGLDGSCNPLAVDALGNLLIADDANNRVRKVDLNGIITTVAGNGAGGHSGDGGAATSAQLSRPLGLVMDGAGNLLIADTYASCVRKVIAPGPVLTLNNLGFSSAYANPGNYDLVVTSPYGSVTSSIVTLALELSPLRATVVNDGSLRLQFAGQAGQTFVLQSAASLNPPINWQPVVTRAVEASGNWSYTNTDLSARPALFYRLTLP